MPRRGQPRVAASATLGTGAERILNRNAVVVLIKMMHTGATALRLKHKIGYVPRVAHSGNPGLEDRAPSGHAR